MVRSWAGEIIKELKVLNENLEKIVIELEEIKVEIRERRNINYGGKDTKNKKDEDRV